MELTLSNPGRGPARPPLSIISRHFMVDALINSKFPDTVKLGNKERFDKEQIGIKESFPVTNLPFASKR